MAVIDKNFTMVESGRLRLSGFPARAAWATVHLAHLPRTQDRGKAVTRWAWSRLTGERDSRVILGGPRPLHPRRPDAPPSTVSMPAGSGRRE
jgi:NADH dehydrogenase